jgi:hypothetical protein
MKTHLLKFTRKFFSVFLAVIFLILIQGCMYYYKVQTANKVNSNGFKVYTALDKYIILHQGDSAWHLSGIGFTDNVITGNLSVLPADRYKFRTTKPKGGTRYKDTKKNNEYIVLDEVHLYMKDSLVPMLHPGNSILISCSSVKSAEIYIKDQRKTRDSWLLPAIGGSLLGFGVLGVIVISASGSRGGGASVEMGWNDF